MEDNREDAHHYAVYVDDAFAAAASLFLMQGGATKPEARVSSQLVWLATLPEFQRCGLGTFLLKYVIEQARQLGIEQQVCVLDARWLLDSIALWEKLPEEEYELGYGWWVA